MSNRYKNSVPNDPHIHTPVVGRLAPSPTGQLHTGNLATFLFTWVQARQAGGQLILRIEDLDPPRVVDGSEKQIMEDLHWLGIDWDEGPTIGGTHAPYRQSARDPLYLNALERLFEHHLIYPCDCSRRDIKEALSAPHTPFDPRTAYPGTCRPEHTNTLPNDLGTVLENLPVDPQGMTAAWRLLATGTIRVDDQLAPPLTHNLAQTPGDFVLRRRDGLWAYQLAVVIDDIAMGITDIVRGRDLLESTPRQFLLYDVLDATRPRTWHMPLIVHQDGQKLSKRNASQSREDLEQAGWTPALLRGACAMLWGWLNSLEELSPADLINLWNPLSEKLSQKKLVLRKEFFEGPLQWNSSSTR